MININDFLYYLAWVVLVLLTVLGLIGLYLFSPAVVVFLSTVVIFGWALYTIDSYKRKP